MRNKGRRALQILLLSLSVCFLDYGYFRGEAPIVLNKAVNICLECIGLG